MKAFSLFVSLMLLAFLSMAGPPLHIINHDSPSQDVLLLTNVSDSQIISRIDKATHELNNVERSLNYWGKVAMSEPVFIANKGQFKLAFDEGISNYVQAAQNNISGAFRSSLQSSLYVGAALQAQFSPPISTGLPIGTNSTLTNNPSTLPAQAENAFNGFTPLLTLGSLSPSLDERQAVEKGVNDEIAQQLLEFMASPDAATNQEQQIVFGIVQITCQPGQHTRSRYVADFNVSVQYGRAAGANPTFNPNVDDDIETNPDVEPAVFAVLPLIDSRNITMQNSRRSQVELASALSAAFAAQGVNAAANTLANYVNRQESDSETRDSVPLVTSYTDGSTFGFQIYPSYETSLKPGKQELEPITFPAVVAILIDKREYYDETNADEIKTGYQGNSWNYLVTESETRWIPLKKPWFFKPDRSLYNWVSRAKDIDAASSDLKWIANAKSNSQHLTGSYDKAYEQLKISCDSLETTALGVWSARFLPDGESLFPKDDKPSITAVFPHELWRDKSTTFTIIVKGITDANDILCVNIGGTASQPKISDCYPSSTNGMAINVQIPACFSSATNSTNAVDFVVLTKKQPITTTVSMFLEGKIAPGDALATITRDSGEKVLSLDIKPGENLPAQQLLDATKQILQRSEAPQKTTYITH